MIGAGCTEKPSSGVTSPPDAPVPFDRFVWKPRPDTKSEDVVVAHPEMPIRELPLPWRVCYELERRNIVCLEDLTAMSEGELRSLKHVGAHGVERIRSMLHAAKLDFAPPEVDPETLASQSRRMMSRRLAQIPVEQRKAELSGLPDSADVGRLGLSTSAMTQCERRGYTTVGALRAASLRDLQIDLGKIAFRRVYEALAATGQGFTSNPSDIELWRAGAVKAHQLRRPDEDAAAVADLEPWIGRVSTKGLIDAGIHTLGALRAIRRSKSLNQVRGIGGVGMNRINAFLGVGAQQQHPATTLDTVWRRPVGLDGGTSV